MVHIVGHGGHPKRIPPPGTMPTRVTRGVAGAQGARTKERTTPDYTRRHMPLRADHSAREGSRPVCVVNPTAAIVAPHVADGVELVATGERTTANSHQCEDHRVRGGVRMEKRHVSYPSASQSPGLTRPSDHRHTTHRAVGQVRRIDAAP